MSKRTINHNSQAFQNRIGPIASGIEILMQLGFTLTATEKGERMVLSDTAVDLELLRQTLQMVKMDSPVSPPAESSFDPTKPIIMTTMKLPEVTKSQEVRVEELEAKMKSFESTVPERNLFVFRAEHGVNPRNFGNDAYSNMMQHADDVLPNESTSLPGDSSLITEIMERKKREMEQSRQLKTRAQRELEQLQRQRMYKRTTIRIHFPDSTIVQAYFAPLETVGDVMSVVRMVLVGRAKDLPFYLFKAPPKEV